MSYKSLLSVITDAACAPTALSHATALAAAFDGHVDALCLGVDRTQTGYYYAGANALIMQETLTRAHQEAEELLSFTQKTLARSGVRWAAEDGVTPFPDLARHVALRARFCDLVIAPQPYGEGRGAELEAVTEAALFDAESPVLVVPDTGAPNPLPKKILIAWNQSKEALAAIRAALPFLKNADLVRIVIVDPPQHGPERSDPGGLLSQMLARHGVSCEIDVIAKTLPRVSGVLNRHVTDKEAEMVVMGAYGHSRFREAILGGATRNMLEQAKVPVIMAH